MKKYGDISYRAGRYVMKIHLEGETFDVAREATKLPTILASVINKVIFVDHKLRVELGKLPQYIDYCVESYRAYYRGKSKQRYEAAYQ